MSRRAKNFSGGTLRTSHNEEFTNRLPKHKYSQLKGLVSSLLSITGTFSTHTTVTQLMEEYKKSHVTLKAIMKIESELNIPLPHRDESEVQRMMAWAKVMGVQTHDVSVANMGDDNYGFRAVNDIEEGSELISVPKSLMITLSQLKMSPLHKLIEENPILKQLPHVALALFILLERFRPDRPSLWDPYFDALPNSYGTTLYFTLDELNELKGSPSHEEALRMERNISRQYAYFWQIFQNGTDEASMILRNIFTYEQYRWATSTVMTRQNYIPCIDEFTVNVIIPVWDFCNHANNKTRDHVEPTTTYETSLKACVCHAPREFRKGDQVTIYYGLRSNSDFFIHNGFVYEDNYHDEFKMKLGIPKTDTFTMRAELLKVVGLPPAGEYYLQSSEIEPIQKNVFAFARIFLMNEDQLRIWKNKSEEEIRMSLLVLPPSPLGVEFDVRVLEFIKTRLSILLRSFPTTLEDDMQRLETECLSQNQRTSIRLIILQKKMLQNASKFCDLKILKMQLNGMPQ